MRSNIVLREESFTDEQINEACRYVGADSFISKLDKGLDDTVIERGSNFSAGQRQLLCIARVMLAIPPMLILDEATSNVDSRTEIKIQEAMRELMWGRTCFVIAHRLSTIQNADCIYVIQNGQITESGNHDELMAKGGFYSTLYQSQFR